MKKNEQRIEYSLFIFEKWELYIAKTEKGLCYVGSPGQSKGKMQEWMNKQFPSATLEENNQSLKPYRNELLNYFQGSTESFMLPIDVKGTPFQEKVWKALKEISYGKTASYSAVAERIQHPAAVRAVGTAIGANPVLIAVPCHRVISKKGSIAGYRGSIELKRYLLDLESTQR